MIELKDLTPGERLWLWQRRHSLSRTEVSERFGYKDGKVATEWQKGRRGSVPEVELQEELTPGEMCAVYRYRSGMTMAEVAEATGMSHVTVIAREQGTAGDPVDDLLPWWQRTHPELGGNDEGRSEEAVG